MVVEEGIVSRALGKTSPPRSLRLTPMLRRQVRGAQVTTWK
jgi:hypothetical protein